MEVNLASPRSFKGEACWNTPIEEEKEALEKSLQQGISVRVTVREVRRANVVVNGDGGA